MRNHPLSNKWSTILAKLLFVLKATDWSKMLTIVFEKATSSLLKCTILLLRSAILLGLVFWLWPALADQYSLIKQSNEQKLLKLSNKTVNVIA